MLAIPPAFLDVPYDGAIVPGPTRGSTSDLAAGANCQVFAYALLAHFGRIVPPLRSRELWDDTVATRIVESFAPLDLMLYAPAPDPFGAHVGVFVGEGQVIHLCQHIGRPAVWHHEEFARHPRYRCFIGAKRVRT